MLHGGDYNPDQWIDNPEILEEDLKFMKLAHTNAFSIGIFSWAALEPEEGRFEFEWLDNIMNNIATNGAKVALATPSGARPAWMSHKYPEVLRTNERREKMLHGGRHNHCLTSPVYREKVVVMNRKLAERYRNHPALMMWHVSNEYSGECHCPTCQQAFRNWLKEKYATLEALNLAWWGPFWSHTITNWEQIESPSPIGENMVHGLNLDWRRFVTDQTIDFYENEIIPLRELTPNIPVTTNFMADTNDLIPFQALDYSKFSKHVDILSWDCYPAWHNDWETTANLAMKVGFINDLYRSLKQQSFLILECTPSGVNWHPVNKTKRPGMHLLSSMQFLAHGSDSVMYFQWRKSRGSSEKFHGAVIDHDRNPNNRVFKEVAEVGKNLEKLSDIVGTMPDSKVAILYDWESNWALNDAQGFGLESKQYPQTLQQHYKAFWEKDIPVDVITKEQDFSKYKLLVVPMLYLMSKSLMKRFQEFANNGGTLVMTYLSGLVDEHDLTYTGGWPKKLQELFSINVLETDTYYPKDTNAVKYFGKTYNAKDYATILETSQQVDSLGTYQQEFYQGSPAVTKNIFGKGTTYFIGARLEDNFHKDFYQNVLDELQIVPPFAIKHDKGVSIQVREDEQYKYVFIMNFTENSQKVFLEQEARDIIADESVSGEIILNAYGVKIVKTKKDTRMGR
ncbi:MAG: beta-galactosidase [Turicibacter sp.]|nr:beta-galactosidase [Turicibacter sp.]